MDWNFPPSGWIWTEKSVGDTETKNTFQVLFRKKLNLERKPEKAIINVSADSRYRLFVNGESVAFGPCKGDNQIWYYEEIDIAPFLREGGNILAAVAVRLSPLSVTNHSVWRTAFAGFYLSGYLQSGGGRTPLLADDSWKYRECDNISFVPENPQISYIGLFEKATGDAAAEGWKSFDYDDLQWKRARLIWHFHKGESPANLLPRPIPQMYEKKALFAGISCVRESSLAQDDWVEFLKGKPLALKAGSIHIVEFDAGELTTGFLRFGFAGGAESKVKILTSECYAYPPEDSKAGMPRKGNRTDSVNGALYGYTDIYKTGGFGKINEPEVYEPFWFRVFRFLRLEIKASETPLTLVSMDYRETGYPLEPKTTVETSDESLKAIWDISLRTLRRCMHETYEDCPFYEQLQYVMDTRLQILYTYSIAADDRLARRAIDDYHRSLRYDGLTRCCFPSMVPNIIPGFSLYYIMMIHDHMMYFGDRELVEKYLPTVEAILGFFERRVDGRGLIGKTGGLLFRDKYWSFIDWTVEWDKTSGVPDAVLDGPITMESLLYIDALEKAADMGEYSGRRAQGEMYRARADAVKKAVNKNCMGQNGLYQDGPGVDKYSQHCQVWAVITETAPKEAWAKLMERALDEPGLAKCSVAMAYYLFRAIEKAGLYGRVKELWSPWQDMVSNNLTTCQEDPVNARSDCHAWGSLILYELPSATLGVRPAKPGYGAVMVNPQVGYIKWAKGEVHTPKGLIHVAWEMAGSGLHLSIQAPKNVEVLLPAQGKLENVNVTYAEN